MIKYFYSTDETAPLEESKDFKDGVWVSVDSPTEMDIDTLIKRYDLSKDYISDALDENEIPRLEHHHGNLYLFTRHVYSDNKYKHSITKAILFVISGDTLLTISQDPVTGVKKLLNGEVECVTNNAINLMFIILNEMTERYEEALIEISRQVKTVRNRLRTQQITNSDFILFARIEDELNEFMSALLPTNAIYRRLSTGRHIGIEETQGHILEDLTLNNEQTVTGCKSLLKTISNVRESYSTIMTNNLNQVIRLLTTITVLISVPTLMASIYGMNIQLPFQDVKHIGPFIIVITISIVLSVLFLLFLRKKKWA